MKSILKSIIILTVSLLSALTFACRGGDGNGEDGERGGDDDGRGSGNDGAVTLLDGTLVAGTSGVIGSSSNTLHDPVGIVFGSDGTLYIADMNNHKIRKVTPPNPAISDYAGTGEVGTDNGSLTAAQFISPSNICYTPEGYLYVADHYTIRRVTPIWVDTMAGTGDMPQYGSDGSEGPALATAITPFAPAYIHGELYFSSLGGFIRKFGRAVPGADLTIFAGGGAAQGDGGQAKNAKLTAPGGMAEGPDGSLYFTETSNLPGPDGNRIRKIDRDGIISTVPGTDTAGLYTPVGVAVAADGTVYISDHNNHRIVKVRNGTATVIVGSGAAGSGSGELNRPHSIVIGPDGWLYVADTSNHRIMKYNIN